MRDKDSGFTDVTIKDPVHSSIAEDPLPLIEAYHDEGIQPEFMQELMSDDFDGVVSWDNMAANELHIGLNQILPPELDFSLALQEDAVFGNKPHWDGNETIESAG
jgi:hypothetical protein